MSDKEPDDIRTALLGSIAEIEEKTPGSTGKLADRAIKAEPEPKPEVKDEPKAEAPDKDPATGKFVAKDKPAEQKPAAESADSAKPEPSKDAAPGTLPADIRATWEALPPNVKAFMAKRETDLSQAAGKSGFEINQLKQKYEPIEALLGPRRAAVTAQHGSVETWLEQLLNYSDFAGQDPEGFLAWYLSQPNIGSRVDLTKLLGQPTQDGAQDQVLASPAVQKLQQTIGVLERRLQQFEGTTQQQKVRSDTSEIDAFEAEKDESGNQKHPHFATLRDTGVLLPQLQIVNQQHPEWSMRQKIAQAYEQAVWVHSDTRNTVLTTQEQKAREEAEAKVRAEAASRARKFVSGGPPTAPSSAGSPKDDLRAEIAANFAAVASAGDRRL